MWEVTSEDLGCAGCNHRGSGPCAVTSKNLGCVGCVGCDLRGSGPWAVTSEDLSCVGNDLRGSGPCGKRHLGAWINSVSLLSLGRWPKRVLWKPQ